MMIESTKIAVCIPTYKVKKQILSVIELVPNSVNTIYVVDDCCPEGSGKWVSENCHDSRVKVLTHPQNLGVGGAMMTGYAQAISEQMDIVVKIDGDGQMDPALIAQFVAPIIEKKADYTKGNRFHRISSLEQMPLVRKIGNSALSFVNKMVSGYWSTMDPTNGYTAIHTKVLEQLQFDRLEKRYFFESDILFQLNIIKAVVKDIPMKAVYEDEQSNLNVAGTLFSFPGKYIYRFFKRILYNYFLRDFNVASLNLIIGLILVFFGFSFGAYKWLMVVIEDGAPTPLGTIMLASLPIILGYQSLQMFLQQDIASVPKEVIHPINSGDL